MELNKDINIFAQTDFRGKKVEFGIKTKDRSRHVYVIGKTGMGKSTMLENMAIQDLKNGHGIGFIDPHGNTAEKLLEYIPKERINDVIYFAPFDLDYPISFNIMEDVGKDQRHLVANGLISSFKKIWPDVWSARMEYILSNTILALLEYPDSTLLGVNRMLSDKDYRNKVVSNISDPSVKSFWVDEFAKYNERYMQEAGDAIKNKIGQFTSNPLIRNIVGQSKSSFDIRKVMDEGKILIMNMSKGRMGEQNANLIGGMLITKIYLAAMSRASASESDLAKLPPFFLFVDEFQSFVNDSFADILSEARKYKLNLTIAHQYIEQMPEVVRNAVFGNVGTTVAFRVGPFDAEVLEKVFTPKFLQEDIVNLGFAQIYLTLMIDGVGSPPFSAVTLPPLTDLVENNKEAIIGASRKQFAHNREEVEEAINKWHQEAAVPQTNTSPRPARPPMSGNSRPQVSPSVKMEPTFVEVAPKVIQPKDDKRISLEALKPKESKIDNGEENKMALKSLVKDRNLGVQAKKESRPANKEELRSALKDLLGEATKKDAPEVKEVKAEVSPAPEPVAAATAPMAAPVNQASQVAKEERPASKEVPEDILRKMLEVKMDE